MTLNYIKYIRITIPIKDYQVKAPNRLWVADITYLGNRENPAYLSLITDAYSKKIVGYDCRTLWLVLPV
ncbi:hypothetical protein [Capnocytophaga canimorsus]|uniref:hypothetical protein n=1 Tax=Capnocytophaga canimorsus TaxID=28188 RepID=UPI0037D65529